jgi:hypothetical protein
MGADLFALRCRWYNEAMMVRVPCALALLTALWGATQARAQVAPDETGAALLTSQSDGDYQRKVADAVAEYDRGNWAEARALFLQAHALQPSARTLRTLGMTAFELRDYASAARELHASLESLQRPLDARLRAEVETLLERTLGFVGRFRVTLDPENAALSVDDQPVQLAADGSLVLGLGKHTLRATARGYAPTQRTMQVEGHEEGIVELNLVSEAPAPAAAMPVHLARDVRASSADRASVRTWTWVAAAGAAAFGGAAVGLWVAGDNELDHLKSFCSRKPSGSCAKGDIDETKLNTLDTLTTASMTTAGVAAIAAIALLFVEGAQPESKTRVSIDGEIPSLQCRF